MAVNLKSIPVQSPEPTENKTSKMIYTYNGKNIKILM